MRAEEYQRLVYQKTEKNSLVKDCFFAFLIGGSICLLGECLKTVYIVLCNIPEEKAGILVSVSLVFLSAFLTGIGVYDKIARVGGAGTLVPITGFANAVVSPVMEFRIDERDIIGLSRKAP